jgi:predicted nucleic acid-binding protein
MEKVPPLVVIDASVAIKWFLPEKESEKALRIRDEHAEGAIDLAAPDLLYYEVANVLSYRQGLERKQLREDIEDMYDLGIQIVAPSRDVLTLATERAQALRVTAYDTAYLVLAEMLGTIAITADDELHKKAFRTRLTRLLADMDRSWTF